MIALDQIVLASEEDDRRFMDQWIADYGTCALSAADEMGIYEALVGGGLSSRDLAVALSLDEAGVRSVCRALVAMGVLLGSGDSFELGERAHAFWLRSSPSYRGHEFDRFWHWDQHERIAQTLKNGWAPLLDADESFSHGWKRGEVSAESARNFTRVMHSLILSPSLAAVRSGAFRNVGHLVDVGGGSGVLAAAVLAHHDGSRATVMDLQPVCDASVEILAETTSGDRVEYFPANFFEDRWPKDADAYSLSNILHDWPMDDCGKILGRIAKALAPGQSLFVLEALLEEGSCSPQMTTLFSMLMQINHRGQQFTERELRALLEEHGFCNVRRVHEYSYWSLVVADKA